MSDGTRKDGERGKAATDEAALSARLQRLGEGLAREGATEPADDEGVDRATTASGYARGFRLSSELVGGVLVGAGLGWLMLGQFPKPLGATLRSPCDWRWNSLVATTNPITCLN